MNAHGTMVRDNIFKAIIHNEVEKSVLNLLYYLMNNTEIWVKCHFLTTTLHINGIRAIFFRFYLKDSDTGDKIPDNRTSLSYMVRNHRGANFVAKSKIMKISFIFKNKWNPINANHHPLHFIYDEVNYVNLLSK